MLLELRNPLKCCITGVLISESVDVWAAGCILFTMLSGYQPFYSKYVNEMIDCIKNQIVTFDCEIWQKISNNAKNLILQLLEKNPKKRPNIISVLGSQWFSKEKESFACGFLQPKFKNNLTKNHRRFSKNLKINENGELDADQENCEANSSRRSDLKKQPQYFSM